MHYRLPSTFQLPDTILDITIKLADCTARINTQDRSIRSDTSLSESLLITLLKQVADIAAQL